MKSLSIFYDSYHEKNSDYVESISDNNFTYFYILPFLQEALQRIKTKDISVIDVGCGVGTISIYLAARVTRVMGIDISPRAISIAKNASKSLNIKNASFKVQSVYAHKSGDYDLLVCSEVIEHIEDDRKFLLELKKRLKNGGYLLLSTPLSDSIFVNTKRYKKFDEEVGHLRRYKTEQIISLIENTGFDIVNYRKTESILRNILFVSKSGFLIKFIRGPLVKIFHAIDSLLVLFTGANDIIILAKLK